MLGQFRALSRPSDCSSIIILYLVDFRGFRNASDHHSRPRFPLRKTHGCFVVDLWLRGIQVHGLYLERYAFRDAMTDVVIQHLISNEKVPLYRVQDHQVGCLCCFCIDMFGIGQIL